MLNKTRFAISWAELIFIALIVVGGIGIWAYMKENVESEWKPKEPVEEFSINTTEVITEKANLANIQAELIVLQEELGNQRASLEQTKAQIQALQTSYPSLASFPDSDFLALDILKAYWDDQLQTETLERQIGELNTQIDALIDQKTQYTLRLEKLEEGTEAYLVVKEQSAFAEIQLVTFKEKIGELKLNLTEKQAQLLAMEELYSGLVDFSLTKQTVRYPSSDILQKYLEALSTEDETESILASLEKQASMKRTAFVVATTALTEAQVNAHNAFLTAQKDFLDRKEAQVKKVSATWSLVYILTAILLYGIIATIRKSLTSFLIVLTLSLIILLILIAYQEFQLMGGALLGLVFFIILLLVIGVANRKFQSGDLK